MLRENKFLAGSVFLALVGLLLLNSLGFLPFFSDDALISLRYVERLATGQGLNWTAGEPVEGYSNLLWILALVPFEWLSGDLVRAARVLGLSCVALTLGVLLVHALRRKSLRECGWSVSIAGVCFASAAPVGAWSIGGLEQPLLLLAFAVLLAASLDLLREGPTGRAPWLWRVSAVALTWTRPDGILLVAAVALALGLFARKSIPLRRQATLWLPALAAAAAQELFRWGYYGDWLPNTARIKLSPTAAHLGSGWDYLRWGTRALLPLPLVALGALALLWRRRANHAAAAVLSSPALFWSAYVVFIGGDIFPAWRHLLPLFLLMLFCLVEAQLRDLRVPVVGASRRVGLLAGILIIAGFSYVQQADPENRRAMEERWEWFGKEIGLAMRSAFADREPLIAVSAAGCIPYWSGLPAVDMLGLNDAHIARRPPLQAGEGYLGHEFGDGLYVLEREPDIICFGVGATEPGFRSGRELWSAERFHAEYQPVRLRLQRPEPFGATLYLRKSSEKLGLRAEADALTIPAFFFATGGGARALVSTDGSWELDLDGSATAELVLEAAPRGSLRPAGGDGWSLVPREREGRLELRLSNLGNAPLRLREFRLARARERG